MENFFGRRTELDEILTGAPGVGGLFEIQGIKGAGKTELLKALEHEIVDIRGDRVARFEMDAIRWGVGRADAGKEFALFCTAFGRILRALPDFPEINDLIATVRTYTSGSAAGGAPDSSRGGYGAVGAGVVDRNFAEVVTDFRSAMAKLARDCKEAAEQRVYLLIDAFESVPSGRLRSWFLELFSFLDGIVVVLADQAIKRIPLLTVAHARILWLDGLSEQEVHSFLSYEPGVGPDVDEIVAPVMRFTEGHAQSVALAANVIKETGGPAQSIRLLRRLAALDKGPGQMIGPLVKEIINTATSPEMQRALDAVLVMRRFDVESLAGVLKIRPYVAEQLVQRLSQYSFVHQRENSDGTEYFQVHRFIREVGTGLLQKDRRASYAELQNLALDYYEAKVIDLPEKYEDWFKYENQGWQISLQEWLYHVSRFERLYRLRGRVVIARIWFDAFWWWGNYIEFPLCEHILNEYSEAAVMFGDRDDEAWCRQLRDVYRLYPKGWRRVAKPADWQDLDETLGWLLRHGELTEPTLDDSMKRHLRAFIDIYIAEARRFLDPDDPSVDTVLDDAGEQFAADDDGWDLVWLAFQRADAALARGESARATRLVDEVAPQLEEQDDREIKANLHRIYADARWQGPERDVVGAMDSYAWAVFHAYHFQIMSPTADTYTKAFLDEMHERAIERLSELAASGDLAAVSTVCARIRTFFQYYWKITFTGQEKPDFAQLMAANRTSEVLAQLFPPAPVLSGLDEESLDDRYLKRAGNFFERCGIDRTLPPGSPLPIQAC